MNNNLSNPKSFDPFIEKYKLSQRTVEHINNLGITFNISFEKIRSLYAVEYEILSTTCPSINPKEKEQYILNKLSIELDQPKTQTKKIYRRKLFRTIEDGITTYQLLQYNPRTDRITISSGFTK